jgi:hypothetical protein
MLVAGGTYAQPRPVATGLTASDAIPVTDPSQIAAWLRRLVGRYRFEGMVQVDYVDPGADPEYGCVDPATGSPRPFCKSVHGIGDCVSVGKGPGVQCVLNVAWEDIYEVLYPQGDLQPGEPPPPVGAFTLPGGVSYLDPAMALFGIDPGKSGINYLLVDNKGLPEGGMGFLAGDRATFKAACVNAAILFNGMKPPPRGREPPHVCERILRIDARPDGKLVYMSFDIEINGDHWTRYEMSLRRVAQDDASTPPVKASASR